MLDRLGVVLVMGSFGREKTGRVLRLFIERPGANPNAGSGVDVDLCASVSREVGAALDISDAVLEPYTLEVSSPGIERPLVQLDDYERFTGRIASIKTREPVSGRRSFKGRLRGVSKDEVLLEAANNEHIAIPCGVIKKANLVFEFKR